MHDASRASGPTGLLNVDETDRLQTTGSQQVRDDDERNHPGVILLGTPGIEKRLTR